LFFAETVTLAHLARAAVLAQAASEEFETYLAASPIYDNLFNFKGIKRLNLASLSPKEFLKRLSKGKPVYTKDEITSYVEQDLRIINDINPDIVVGDFRISLYISSKITKVPYISITNAYWSPHSHQTFTVPELPFVKILGPKTGQFIFDLARPIAFKLQAKPFAQVCKKYSIEPPGEDLRHIYTTSDLTLFSDIYELHKDSSNIGQQQFIGPVLWSPEVPLPNWWNKIPSDKPLAYITMGSSGNVSTIPYIIKALEHKNCAAIVANLGKNNVHSSSQDIFVADYLPGEEACKRADFIICNGGSPTTQQALSAGKPVIGVSRNLDQYLNMETLNRFGAGITIRSDSIDLKQVEETIEQVLGNSKLRNKAEEIAFLMKNYNPKENFMKSVNILLNDSK